MVSPPEVELDEGQGGLWDVDELLAVRSPGHVGQVERMLTEAVQEAVRIGKLAKTDLGLLGGALAGARSLDVAMSLPSIKGGYLVAQLLTPYRETCQALGLPRAVVPDDGEGPQVPGNGQPQDGDWLGDHFGTPR